MNSKTTFVTVNLHINAKHITISINSKTTFVTVNRQVSKITDYINQKFKNNFCYC